MTELELAPVSLTGTVTVSPSVPAKRGSMRNTGSGVVSIIFPVPLPSAPMFAPSTAVSSSTNVSSSSSIRSSSSLTSTSLVSSPTSNLTRPDICPDAGSKSAPASAVPLFSS